MFGFPPSHPREVLPLFTLPSGRNKKGEATKTTLFKKWETIRAYVALGFVFSVMVSTTFLRGGERNKKRGLRLLFFA